VGRGGYSQALFDPLQHASDANTLFIAARNGDKRSNGINNDRSPHDPSSYITSNTIAVAAIDSSGAKTTWSNYGATTVDIGARRPASTQRSPLIRTALTMVPRWRCHM
jgi:hypothetical protein